jgi:hypothetical protein
LGYSTEVKQPAKDSMIRLAACAVATLAFISTLRLNFFTLAQIPRAATRIPWMDEWVMLREFSLYEQGARLGRILWSSYWGHRLVIPRLIVFADTRWASRASLTWLTLFVEFTHIVLLISLAWVLFRQRSLFCFALSTAAILNLMLSPYQMENFVWSMQTMFPLVYAAGTVSFLCLALSGRKKPVLFTILSIAAGLTGTLTMPNGILIWPVLVAQALCLKLSRRYTIALAIIGIAVAVLYGWNYERPALGLGLGGMLHHPLTAAMLLGLLLGGPLDFLPFGARIATALMAAAVAGYVAVRVLRKGVPEGTWVSVLVAINLFLILSAASIVAGRLGPEWLQGQLVLPSRYFTLLCTFWTTIALLVLYGWSRHLLGVVFVSSFGVLFCFLMFLHPKHQRDMAEDWADFFRGTDAVGAAFLLHAPDEELIRNLASATPERDESVAFMRGRHIGIFAEARAQWPGKRISEIFRVIAESRCTGAVERATPLTTSDSGAWRVEGWALDVETGRAPDDLVITDSTGEIAGLARGGLRHRYIPGFFTDTDAPPVFHGGLRRSEWLGYVRESSPKPWTVYGVWPQNGKVCRVASAP